MSGRLLENPFPRPSTLESVLLRELVEVASQCYRRGWCHGTAGNFSLKGRNGLTWQSPSGQSKANLDPNGFIPVVTDSGRVIMPSSPVPSFEMPVHLGIYRSISDAGCVIHAHPPHLVCRSAVGQDLRWIGHEMQKALGGANHLTELLIPVIPNPTPHIMSQLSEIIGKYLKPSVPLVVLAGHGAYVWGKTPTLALGYLEAAEFLCQSDLLMK